MEQVKFIRCQRGTNELDFVVFGRFEEEINYWLKRNPKIKITKREFRMTKLKNELLNELIMVIHYKPPA